MHFHARLMKADKNSQIPPTARPGDIILFYGPHNVLSGLISLLTRSKFYHVAMADHDHIIEAAPKGVMRTSMAEKHNHKFVIIPAPSDSVGRAALKWAEEQVGDGYDPADLLAIVLDRIFRHLHINLVRSDRYTCGEFVATAYAKAGMRLFPDIDCEAVVPADFARLLPEASTRPSAASVRSRLGSRNV